MSDVLSEEPLTVINDVRELSPIPAEGLGHSTVLKHAGVRVVVLAFTAGHILKEHSTPSQLLLQAIDGELILRANSIDTVLRPGGVVRLEPGLRHEVEAVTDARLMLTLISGS